jgi:hypothetical protein
VHSKVVFELPPRDSFKNLVSIESLNGTWPPSTNLLIHSPSWVRLKLIFCASLRVWPVAPVLDNLSLPARSTRLSLAIFFEPSVNVYVYYKTRIVWLRELLSFWLVEATYLLF